MSFSMSPVIPFVLMGVGVLGVLILFPIYQKAVNNADSAKLIVFGLAAEVFLFFYGLSMLS